MQAPSKVSAADLLLIPLIAGLLIAFFQLGFGSLLAAVIATGLLVAVNAGQKILLKDARLVPHCFLFGLSIVLLPFFGTKTLFPAVLVFLMIERSGVQWGWYRSWLPLFLAAAAWCLSSFIMERTWEPVLFLYRNSEGFVSALSKVSAWLQSGAPVSIRSFEWILRLFSVFAMASIVAGSVPKRSSIIAGIAVAAAVAVPLSVIEIYLLRIAPEALLHFANTNEYWLTLRRISGTASDPNSYGVGTLLVVPILWDRSKRLDGRKRLALRILSAALLLLAVFSGSRTLFLGVALIGAGLLSRRRRWALTVAAMIIGFIALLNFSPAIQSALNRPSIPEGIQRIAELLTISNFEAAVANRTVFLRTGYTLFTANPWLGVGLERFRDLVVPLTFGTPGVIPLWTDNSNNFYLAIAVELGIFGVLFSIAGLISMQFRSLANRATKIAVVTFLVVLLTGPHLEFIEISALFGILLGLSVEPRREKIAFTTACALGLMPCIALKSYFGQFGFYGWEQQGGRYFRWSTTHAQSWIKCDATESETPLIVRSARPDSQVEIEVAPVGLPKRQAVLQSGEELSIPIQCPAAGRPEVVLYQLSVSPPFTPGSRADGRVLGVQVVTDDPRESSPVVK